MDQGANSDAPSADIVKSDEKVEKEEELPTVGTSQLMKDKFQSMSTNEQVKPVDFSQSVKPEKTRTSGQYG